MITPADYDPALVEHARRNAVPVMPELVASHPYQRVAARDDDGTLSFGALAEEARRLAGQLESYGVGPGDVIGVQLPNSRSFLIVHLALAQLGAVMATVHRPYQAHERDVLLDFVGARAWIGTDSRQQIAIQPCRARLGNLQGDAATLAVDVHTPDGALQPLAVFFTSGTHSLQPKPCLHSHATLLGNAAQVARDADIWADDVLISASPFTHLFGILSCHLGFLLGAEQILLERFDPARFLMLSRKCHATVAFLVPTHLRDLLGYLDSHPHAGVGLAFREVRVAGAPLSPSLVETARNRLQAPVVNHWGMTEVGAGICTHRSDPGNVPAHSLGRPLSGANARIVGDDGRSINEPGTAGELWFRSPWLFHGYYRNPQATRENVIVDDSGVWFRTGDLASWTAEGRIAYRGRIKDIINRGGMKIGALEVEAVLLGMPGVRQAALVAEPDARLGERAVLVVSLEPGRTLTLDEVRSFLAERGLAKYKWPERLVVWDAIPTTASGKVAKARVLERLCRDENKTGEGYD